MTDVRQHLAVPIQSGHARDYIMQVAVGYFDESSDEDTQGVCYTVAGFVGNNLDTAVLDLRWRDLLTKYHLDYFKASELNAGEGQFKQYRDNPHCARWTPFSDNEKHIFTDIKTAFTDAIISSDGLTGIGAAIILPDYERLRTSCPPAKTNLLYPYFLCVNVVLMEVGLQFVILNNRYRDHERIKIRPVFDSHEKYSGRMKQGLDSFCQKNPLTSKYLLPMHYEDDKAYLGLQAADDLAFEIRKAVVALRDDRKERIPMSRLKKAGRIFKIYRLDYESLKRIADSQRSDFNPLQPLDYTLEDIMRQE